MQRMTQFSFRVSKEERRAIALLADQLQRSQSDAVRYVVIIATRELKEISHPILDERQLEERGEHVTA